MSNFAWTIAFFCAAVAMLVLSMRLDTRMRKRKLDPAAKHRLVVVQRCAFGVAVTCLLGMFLFMMRGISQDNGTYAKQCHDRGGVVTHDGCFKPGSEIHIP